MDTSLTAINWPLCIELASNNADVAEELLGMFVAELPQTSEDLKQHYMQQDWHKFRDRVHKLHGGACYVGVPVLKEAAKTLEQLLADDQSPEVLTQQYERLLKAIDDVAECYQAELYKTNA